MKFYSQKLALSILWTHPKPTGIRLSGSHCQILDCFKVPNCASWEYRHTLRHSLRSYGITQTYNHISYAPPTPHRSHHERGNSFPYECYLADLGGRRLYSLISNMSYRKINCRPAFVQFWGHPFILKSEKQINIHFHDDVKAWKRFPHYRSIAMMVFINQRWILPTKGTMTMYETVQSEGDW